MTNTILFSASVQEPFSVSAETSCILREAAEEAAQENTTQHLYRIVLQPDEGSFAFALYFPETAASLKEEVKRIPGSQHSAVGGNHWQIPTTPLTADALLIVLGENWHIFAPPYIPECLRVLASQEFGLLRCEEEG